jgi:hypothetical protein
MKLYNLPLLKHVYYWHVLPKENLSPSIEHEANFQLFQDALFTINFVRQCIFALAIIVNITVAFTCDIKVLCLILSVSTIVVSVVLLKKQKLLAMISDYDDDRIRRACF